jgi:trans-aconitate methyltransferase
MDRIPEPELMDAANQAAAYAAADFSESNSLFVDLLRQKFPGHSPRKLIDLGCGPGDILVRIAGAWPDAQLTGVDGSPAMLEHARRAISEAGLGRRVELLELRLQDETLPRDHDTIVSNSLLHHLADPGLLWRRISELGRPGAVVLVMDLVRPDTEAAARELLRRYAHDEPEILQRDFYRSLLAAFRPEEIRAQLAAAGLGALAVEPVSDRHVAVFGQLTEESR